MGEPRVKEPIGHGKDFSHDPQASEEKVVLKHGREWLTP